MTYLIFTLGLLGLFFGGEALVRGATAIARHFGLSPVVIGLTIVGFGTSAPELLVSVQAAFAGQPGLALGSALGSNVSNILLILGLSALLAPLVIPFRSLRRDFAFMLGAAALIWWMMADGMVSRLDGVILVGLLAFFILSTLKLASLDTAHRRTRPDAANPESALAPTIPAPEGAVEPPPMPVARAWITTGIGLMLLVIGARFLVDSATEIARGFGISEAVIGLTIVAVGTSLPELATSVIATLRKQTDIAVGNVVGSNIFNILGIIGTTALILPIPSEPRFSQVDMLWVMGASIALVVLAATLKGLPRWAGAALMATYLAYVLTLV